MCCLANISSQLDSLSDMAFKDLHSELLHQIIKEVCGYQPHTHCKPIHALSSLSLVSLSSNLRFLHSCRVAVGIWQLSMNLQLGDDFLHTCIHTCVELNSEIVYLLQYDLIVVSLPGRDVMKISSLMWRGTLQF